MSNANIDTDQEFINLPSEIYQTTLNEIITNNCNLKMENCEVFCSPGSSKGDNYIGVVYRVTVRSKKHNSDKLNLIVKLPPQNLARREQFFVRPTFIREADFYDNIYPMYRKFQEEKNIDVDKEGFHQIPFCYKTLTDEPYEGLYFEDLKAKGFEMFDRLKDISEEHVELVMKTLAKMHAIFFCMKDQKSAQIHAYREIVDIFLQRKNDQNMSAWFESVKKQAKDCIVNCGNNDMIQKVDKLLEMNFFELLESCLLPEHSEPYAVICHGDCWNNNILFKYDKNGKPVDIRLLDFQIIRYASPVCDLMYYIFACTTKSLRDKYYQYFMDTYYESLSEFIKRLGSSPEKVFPRIAFNEHLKRFGKFGFIMAMMVLPLFTSTADDIPNMDEIADKFQESMASGEVLDTSKMMDFSTLKTINVYNERMSGVIQDLYCFGYL